ncbi:MAG: hypothetical protein H6587_03780 [Flavobacteriales bacterium]|nr:hypothetical protein [Flavobacteriales bacterium]MCB9363670.1 hypothetical protein [Flavobacteriales bacterium]
MSQLIPGLNDLSSYYNRTDLLEKVVAQIQKDFNWFNFTITFKEDKDESPYQQLYKQILPLVDEMLNDDYIKLMSLLYRIDIEEDFLNRKLKENAHADTDEVIADLIIKRELQKVIIKEMYSAK